MTDIPEDVLQAADSAWMELASLNDLTTTRRDAETSIIAKAILAERERCMVIITAPTPATLDGPPAISPPFHPKPW